LALEKTSSFKEKVPRAEVKDVELAATVVPCQNMFAFQENMLVHPDVVGIRDATYVFPVCLDWKSGIHIFDKSVFTCRAS
tara:strand:+ start:711 stop:950 length:240 start_codon:yes stop_codon:yes gene_type:complete